MDGDGGFDARSGALHDVADSLRLGFGESRRSVVGFVAGEIRRTSTGEIRVEVSVEVDAGTRSIVGRRTVFPPQTVLNSSI